MSAPPSPWCTVPNAISLARLLAAPVALWVAHRGDGALYKWFFTVAVATDALDGLLARLLRQKTLLGARLDAAADGATYLVLFFAVSWLWPQFILDRRELLITALALYGINHGFSLVRFGKLPAYHSWAGKVAAVVMAAGMIVWFIGGPGWIFTAGLIVTITSGVEQLFITATLRGWAAEVPTWWHARRLRRQTTPG